MDHDAYENEMIEAINRHGEAAAEEVATEEATEAKWSMVMNKSDARVIVRGLKRILLALLTAATFAIAVIGLIVVATAPGYLAVVLFFASILAMVCSFVLLYAQGIICIESKGESK